MAVNKRGGLGRGLDALISPGTSVSRSPQKNSEKIIEKRVEVPVEKIVEKRVEVPVEKIVEKRVEVPLM